MVEPCVAMGWSSRDFDTFLEILSQVFVHLKIHNVSTHARERWNGSLASLFTAVRLAGTRMMDSFAGNSSFVNK